MAKYKTIKDKLDQMQDTESQLLQNQNMLSISKLAVEEADEDVDKRIKKLNLEIKKYNKVREDFD